MHYHDLEGEVGDWLRERGHSGQVSELDTLSYMSNHNLTIEDPDVALLFKLTWL